MTRTHAARRRDRRPACHIRLRALAIGVAASLVVFGHPSLAQPSAGPTPLREARSADGKPLDPARIRDTAVASLVRAEKAFMDDVERRRLAGWVEAFADSGATFPLKGPIVVGRAAVRDGMASTFADTSVHIAWHPVYATVSSSGDLGYTYGYYRWNSRDDNGKPAPPLLGKFVTVWRRGANGRWEVAVDLGNAGPVPAGFFANDPR